MVSFLYLASAVVGVGAVVTAIAAHHIARRNGRREARRAILGQAAARLGFDFHRDAQARGDIGGVAVVIREVDPPRGIELAATGTIPPKIALRCQSSVPGSASRDLLTGDIEFDREIVFEGDAAVGAALLDERCRQEVLNLKRYVRGRVESGRIWIGLRAPYDESQIVAAAGFAQRLALLLATRPIDEALAANACSDGNPGVRRRNLRILLAEFPKSEHIAKVAHVCIEDPEPSLRLAGAGALGARGIPVLSALVEDTSTPFDVLVDALQRLFRLLAQPDALRLCAKTLAGSDAQLWGIGLSWLDERGLGMEFSILERFVRSRLDEEYDPAVLASAALALSRSGDPRAEGTLHELLVRGDSVAVRSTIAGLGNVGTVRSVEPLRRVGRRFIGKEFDLLASTAVQKIQARISNAGPGQLSVMDHATGSLSVADTGALSLSGVKRPI